MKHLPAICLVVMLCFLFSAADADTTSITCQIGEYTNTAIQTIDVNGTAYLFLPACALTEPMILYGNPESIITLCIGEKQTIPIVSGKPFMLPASSDSEYSLLVQTGSGIEQITIMLSANIAALFLNSSDPLLQGREWLESCEDHERSTTGTAVLICADGSLIYAGTLDEIRGRGNTTWWYEVQNGAARAGDAKRPYQIKLSKNCNLLNTGIPAEANKRWILLADYFDSTLLRTQIALDMAFELGLTETSKYRPIDLFYDGEYRGHYLLTEKVEAGHGRIDTVDDTGGYLIELDSRIELQDEPAFTLPNGFSFGIQSPKEVSDAALLSVNNLFTDLYETINSQGIHPNTGALWSEYFDVDALLAYYWINEWSRNIDTWCFSSTYFTLPAQSQGIRMGPVWDFDLAFYDRLQADESITDASGLIETSCKESLGYGLFCIPEFRSLAAVYYMDILTPLVTEILLGDESAHGSTLHSLAWYWERDAASRRMNDILWNPTSLAGNVVAPTYKENYQLLRTFIKNRTTWLSEETARWQQPQILNMIEFTLRANYCNTEKTLYSISVEKDIQYTISTTFSQLRPATETSYAVWNGVLCITPCIGYQLAENCVLIINGVTIPCQLEADGSLKANIWFEDPSYRPAEYMGVDYGLVFDAQYYAAQHPELAADMDSNSFALLKDYVDYGIPAGQVGNSFFDPQEILEKLPDVKAMLGSDYETVLLFFTEIGYEDWMCRLGKLYLPVIQIAAP